MSRGEGEWPLPSERSGSPSPYASGTDPSRPPAPLDFPSVGGPVDPKTQQARLALRIVVHLYRIGPLPSDETVQIASTQQGIAVKLDVSQGAVSKVLRRLIAVDVVWQARHHVRGQPRRMRAYFLTRQGVDLARRCKERYPDA